MLLPEDESTCFSPPALKFISDWTVVFEQQLLALPPILVARLDYESLL